jgi:hypothetical protein
LKNSASPASRVTEQSSLQVGYQSAAVVGFSDGSQVQLRPNTTVSFNRLTNETNRQGSEIFIEQGSISAFVKKPDGGGRNDFRIRTPTKVAGVRGSFVGFSKRGREHRVEAIESSAYIKEESLPTTTREKLQKAYADLERSELQSRDTAAEIKDLLKAPLATPNDKATQDWLGTFQDHKSLQKALVEEQKKLNELKSDPARAAELKESAGRILALTGEQLKWARAAYESEFEAALVEAKAREKEKKDLAGKDADDTVNIDILGENNIPEGDTVTWEDTLNGPREFRAASSRARRYTGSGMTEAESRFASGNSDYQNGAGNDTQNFYNSTNAATQTDTPLLPTLKKF